MRHLTPALSPVEAEREMRFWFNALLIASNGTDSHVGSLTEDWERFTSEIAEPKQGKGIDLNANAAALRTYFRNQSGGSVYMAFCVFEDWFPAFIRAKQLATESGLAYGWDPFRLSDGPVSFGVVGHTPMPQ
jgi:hypothetical protein